MNKYFNMDLETHYRDAMCPHCEKHRGTECRMDIVLVQRNDLNLKIQSCANYEQKAPEGRNE